MTLEEKRINIKLWIERSIKTLKQAKTNCNEDDIEIAVNRLYYSLFYAVTALLITKDLYSSKHKGVLNIFNKEFIKEQLISQSVNNILRDLFPARQIVDYEPVFSITIEQVQNYYNLTVPAVKEIINYLQKNNYLTKDIELSL